MKVDARFDDDKCLRTLSYLATDPVRKKDYHDAFESSESISLHDPSQSFKDFSRSWIGRFYKGGDPFERFIYLWFTFNSWLSLVVPDETQNDRDDYLIHAIAGAGIYADRFEKLLSKDKKFCKNVQEFINQGPVFRVSWMKRNNRTPWHKGMVTRTNFVEKIYNEEIKDKKFEKSIPYSPQCAFSHNVGEIPCDWHHAIHMIYQVRCNLFHGGKVFDSVSDKQFVRGAFSILWSMFQEEDFIKNVLQELSGQ